MGSLHARSSTFNSLRAHSIHPEHDMICELDRQLQKANHPDGTFELFSYASKDRRQFPSRIEFSVIKPYSLFIAHPGSFCTGRGWYQTFQCIQVAPWKNLG